MKTTTEVVETTVPNTIEEAEALVREILRRSHRAPEETARWIVRKERTSPLDTRHVTR